MNNNNNTNNNIIGANPSVNQNNNTNIVPVNHDNNNNNVLNYNNNNNNNVVSNSVAMDYFALNNDNNSVAPIMGVFHSDLLNYGNVNDASDSGINHSNLINNNNNNNNNHTNRVAQSQIEQKQPSFAQPTAVQPIRSQQGPSAQLTHQPNRISINNDTTVNISNNNNNNNTNNNNNQLNSAAQSQTEQKQSQFAQTAVAHSHHNQQRSSVQSTRQLNQSGINNDTTVVIGATQTIPAPQQQQDPIEIESKSNNNHNHNRIASNANGYYNNNNNNSYNNNKLIISERYLQLMDGYSINKRHVIHLTKYYNSRICFQYMHGNCRYHRKECNFFHPPKCGYYVSSNLFNCNKKDLCNYAHITYNNDNGNAVIRQYSNHKQLPMNVIKKEKKEKKKSGKYHYRKVTTKAKQQQKQQQKNNNNNNNNNKIDVSNLPLQEMNDRNFWVKETEINNNDNNEKVIIKTVDNGAKSDVKQNSVEIGNNTADINGNNNNSNDDANSDEKENSVGIEKEISKNKKKGKLSKTKQAKPKLPKNKRQRRQLLKRKKKKKGKKNINNKNNNSNHNNSNEKKIQTCELSLPVHNLNDMDLEFEILLESLDHDLSSCKIEDRVDLFTNYCLYQDIYNVMCQLLKLLLSMRSWQKDDNLDFLYLPETHLDQWYNESGYSRDESKFCDDLLDYFILLSEDKDNRIIMIQRHDRNEFFKLFNKYFLFNDDGAIIAKH